MVVATDLHKSFGRLHAVRGVGFDVPRGQIVGLLGPNGAGKTTTIRMLTGYSPPDAGRVEIAGVELTPDHPGARRAIGYLPEAAPLYTEMTPESYLHFRGRLYGLDRRARARAVERALGRCHLLAVRARRIAQLSKGYKQRTALAGALVHDPEVLVLDEPTNGLDPGQIHETRRFIRELAQDRTMIVSSHILPEIEQTCDRVIILARGRVRADGPPASLIQTLSDWNACIAEVRRTPTLDPGAFLRSVPGVAEITLIEPGPGGTGGGEWQAFHVYPERGVTDLRERVAAAAIASGALVRELRREIPTLEQLFLRLIEDDGAGAPAPGASEPAGARAPGIGSGAAA